MRRKIIALIVMGLLLSAAVLAADSERNTISVRGDGQVESVPDMATLTIGAEITGSDMLKVQQQNNDIINRVRKQLLVTIDEKNITTSNLSIMPEWDYSGKTPIIAGYKSTNNLMVKVYNLSILGNILQLSLSAGANQMGDIRFACKDNSEQQAQALRLAVQDAYTKAQLLAKAAGRTLGKAITIHENNPGSTSFAMFALDKSAGNSAVPISPGQLQFKASVEIVYELIN